jgi:replication factor C subunit 2/4
MENLDVPFIEKYRPLVLSEVTGNEIGIEQLKTIAKTGNLPHLLITGPPGTGKTTSIMCLAREMLKETFKFAVLELNASDDRGIDVVREKIKHFAQQKITVPKGIRKQLMK